MLSVNSPEYLDIMKVWRADQAQKAAEKKASQTVVEIGNGEEGVDDGGVQMNRPSRAQQERERKNMRKREKARKWFRDLI
jgi:hypothetical protein